MITSLEKSVNDLGLTVADAKTTCSQCEAPLCLRKQVINLALGNSDEMFCLECLAKDSSQRADEVLSGIQAYIVSRDCFRKQWERYVNVDYCPDPNGCFPAVCFAGRLVS